MRSFAARPALDVKVFCLGLQTSEAHLHCLIRARAIGPDPRASPTVPALRPKQPVDGDCQRVRTSHLGRSEDESEVCAIVVRGIDPSWKFLLQPIDPALGHVQRQSVCKTDLSRRAVVGREPLQAM